MKKIKWLNGNKMIFESEHKTFNCQCKCVTKGTAIGNVNYSSYVRPYNETKCNNTVFPKGHLQNYDLNWLLKDLPYYVKEWIIENGKKESLIAYHFFYRKNNKKIDIGYVVTDDNYNLLICWYVGSRKAHSALKEAIKYISN